MPEQAPLSGKMAGCNICSYENGSTDSYHLKLNVVQTTSGQWMLACGQTLLFQYKLPVPIYAPYFDGLFRIHVEPVTQSIAQLFTTLGMFLQILRCTLTSLLSLFATQWAEPLLLQLTMTSHAYPLLANEVTYHITLLGNVS